MDQLTFNDGILKVGKLLECGYDFVNILCRPNLSKQVIDGWSLEIDKENNELSLHGWFGETCGARGVHISSCFDYEGPYEALLVIQMTWGFIKTLDEEIQYRRELKSEVEKILQEAAKTWNAENVEVWEAFVEN